MDKNLAKFLQDIAVTAANAADSARSAVETAGKAAMEKYDEVKTQRELARERAAQEDILRAWAACCMPCTWAPRASMWPQKRARKRLSR